MTVVQIHSVEIPFTRGVEKAMFQFGGSAVVMFGEPGRWKPSRIIVAYTSEGVETLVRLGAGIAEATEHH
jgi:phosphatidylserine decarboxylase